MPKLGRKYQALIVAILIILPIFIFSCANVSSSWQPRVYGGDPTTPTGIIHTVTATPDSKILVRIDVESPSTEYIHCQIILVPPGDQGGDSSGQAKLLKIDDQGIEPYNETILLEILPADASEHLNFTTYYIKLYDSLVINCSILGHIPEGRWIIFLTYNENEVPIMSATWTVNETPVSNQSLTFTGVGIADPMLEYGFVYTPQYGYFGTVLFFFSGFTLIALIVGLYSILKNDNNRKRA